MTGASGFLGGHLVKALLKKNVEVTAVVRDAGKLTGIKNGLLCVVEADLADYAVLDKKVLAGSYDAFYHFAWAGTSGEARADAALQLFNVKSACEAVGAAKRLGCRRFVNAGSLMEYEAAECMRAPGLKPDGNYLYRSAKLAAHYMAKAEAGRTGLPFVNLIISNVYGEGELSARLISATLRKLVKGERVSFTAGAQLYDFIYMEDALEAFYQAGENGKPYCDYYIGSGQIRPLREYIEELYGCLPAGQKPWFGDVPYDGVRLSYCEFDREALARDTGFVCRVPFEEGIRRTYAWMKEAVDAGISI